MNRFDQLGQPDADTTASEDLPGDDAPSTTPGDLVRHTDDTIADAIEDLARHTDDTIAEINAISASSPVFSDDLHRLEQSIVSRISTIENKIVSLIETKIKITISSMLSDLHHSLAFTTKALVADITNINDNMKIFKERVDTDHASMTAAIATLSRNTARLSEETSTLSVRVVEHQDHLENLLGFEEARQTQMDDHWKSIAALTSRVEEVSHTTATQHQRIAAQLDGLRSTTATKISTLQTDVTDLRGQIIPGLREQSTTIAHSVTRLTECFEASTTSSPHPTAPPMDISSGTPPTHPSLPAVTVPPDATIHPDTRPTT